VPKVLVVVILSSCMLGWSQDERLISNRDMSLLHFVELDYPKLANQALVQGVVVVRAKLDDNGSVVEARALSGAELLIPASVENAKKWRFRPNQEKEAVIIYNFSVDGTSMAPGCRRFTVEPPNFATITTCTHTIQ
jgi:hypothetical protein